MNSMEGTFRPCIIIPCYKHAALLLKNIDLILSHNIHTIIVNDGSPDNSMLKEGLINLNVTLLNLDTNLGKGGAIIEGMKKAIELNFTHALQVDADSQHNYNDIPQFLSEAKNIPEALVLGTPIFDDHAPKERIYGRKISTFLVALETLSLEAHDVLFGFRVYPLEKSMKAIKKFPINCRMGFDAQIIVYLLWQGIRIKNIPTKVKYDSSINSNFRYFADNITFIFMHAHLLLLAIILAPLGIVKRTIKS